MSVSLEAKTQDASDNEAEAYHEHGDHPLKPAGPAVQVKSSAPEAVAHGIAGSLTQHPQLPIGVLELLFGACVLLLWIGFFSAGLSIPTGELRSQLAKGVLDVETTIAFPLVVTCCYTVTNLLFLSCLAALLGCMMCRWRVRDKIPVVRPMPEERIVYRAGRLYLSAALRGFFIYLVGISGLLLVSTETAVENTSFVQYIRLAGFISVISFAAGYEPTLSNRLMGRVTDLANQPGGDRKK